jgi:hypothetical protein
LGEEVLEVKKSIGFLCFILWGLDVLICLIILWVSVKRGTLKTISSINTVLHWIWSIFRLINFHLILNVFLNPIGCISVDNGA